MNQIIALKTLLKHDPRTAGMIKPSTKNEIFMDWDQNGTVDFAFISSQGDGKIDTFAIDLTGDGECDMYFCDTDGNGVCDDIRYYPDGADTPSYTFKGPEVEALIEKEALNLFDLLHAKFDAAVFVAQLREIKDHIVIFSEQLQTNGALGSFKKTLKSFPQTANMIMPSAKNEIFLDLNGDGLADFAFISSKNDNNIDMFAIDTTDSGEFDLYLTDTDGNGIADDVCFYSDGSDEPDMSYGGQELEEELTASTMKFIKTFRKKSNVVELIVALRLYKKELIALLVE